MVKLGSGTGSSGIKIGDRVGVKWVASACGNCGEILPQRSALDLLKHTQNRVKSNRTAFALTRKCPDITLLVLSNNMSWVLQIT